MREGYQSEYSCPPVRIIRAHILPDSLAPSWMKHTPHTHTRASAHIQLLKQLHEWTAGVGMCIKS